MPLVDSTGAPVDPTKVKFLTPGRAFTDIGFTPTGQPGHPVQPLGQRILGVLRGNAAPVAGQIAGQTGGEALGSLAAAALAPESGGLSLALPLVLGALGAGGANVATSKLPEKYGGTPGES